MKFTLGLTHSQQYSWSSRVLMIRLDPATSLWWDVFCPCSARFLPLFLPQTGTTSAANRTTSSGHRATWKRWPQARRETWRQKLLPVHWSHVVGANRGSPSAIATAYGTWGSPGWISPHCRQGTPKLEALLGMIRGYDDKTCFKF